MATSKNNPDARRIDGWRCSKCNTPNPPEALVCGGKTSSRVLKPNARGRGMRANMEHVLCTASKPS